jgi:hypothetical protein
MYEIKPSAYFPKGEKVPLKEANVSVQSIEKASQRNVYGHMGGSNPTITVWRVAPTSPTAQVMVNLSVNVQDAIKKGHTTAVLDREAAIRVMREMIKVFGDVTPADVFLE